MYRTLPIRQPVFGVTSLETQAVAKDGETLLIGSCSTPDGEWVQVGFLTVRLKTVQPRYVVDRPVKVNPQEVQKNEAVMKKLNKIGSTDVWLSPSNTIINAMRLFKEASIKYDESDCSEKERGVNFVVKLPESFWDQTWISTNENIFASAPVSNGVPSIPCTVARYLSLFDDLRLMCDVTGMRFSIRNGIVWIIPHEKELVTRIYSPAFVSYQAVNVEDALRVNYEANGKGRDWKKWFEEFGVPWPSGSSINFLPAFDLLRVTNTPENMDIFEKACKELSLFRRTVEVDVQIHAFRPEDIEKMRLSGGMSVEALMELRKKGKTKPVASAMVMTKSGQEAVMKAVQEVTYPTELLTEVEQAESPVDLESNPQALIPGNFTTRETGITLKVVPEVDADQSQINVTIKPIWVTLEGWKSSSADRASGLRKTKISLRQPVLNVTSFETQTVVKEGQTVLLGSSSSPDGKWVNVGFLTVK
jgi:Bacterial type II and III secretion system protein